RLSHRPLLRRGPAPRHVARTLAVRGPGPGRDRPRAVAGRAPAAAADRASESRRGVARAAGARSERALRLRPRRGRSIGARPGGTFALHAGAVAHGDAEPLLRSGRAVALG